MQLQGFHRLEGLLGTGVYALVYKGRVVYIGQAKQVLKRIYEHRAQWAAARRGKPYKYTTVRGILFDDVWVQPCHPDRIDELEKKMIQLYKPKFNVQLKTPGPTTEPVTIKVDGITITLNKPRVPPSVVRRI